MPSPLPAPLPPPLPGLMPGLTGAVLRGRAIPRGQRGTSRTPGGSHGLSEGAWADRRGEYLSAYHASEVYRLLGKKGLESEESPEVGKAIIKSDVGYHNREGGHSIDPFDWERFMEFAEYHFKKTN